MKKNVVIDTNLLRTLAIPSVPRNKSQFFLYDDPDSDNWNDYIVKGKKIDYLTTN